MTPQGQRDPWDKPPPSPIPFDIEKFEQAVKKWIIPAIIVFLVIIAASSSYFTVDRNEEAVILRFGKYSTTVGPGLHFKYPLIEKALIEEVETVQREEFGFRTVKAAVESTFDYSSSASKEESLMLTADLNAVVINWVVRYKIKDLKDYLFNVDNVKETIRDISETVMRRIVGDRSVDEVLMIQIQEIENIALEEVKQILDEYKCGIYVESVKLKSVDPPEEVKDAFDAVPQARQKKEQFVTDAEAKRNREIPLAEGMKARMIAEAEGYKDKRVKESEGDTRAFLAVLEEYQKAKDITRRRLYLETMAKVLPRCGKLYLVDEEQKGILPLLQLGEEKGEKK